MKNKLIATFAASALAMGISAAVQADAHPYAGVGVGYFDSHSNLSDTVNEGIGALQLGYHFDEDWSVELSHSEGIATQNDHIRVASLTAAYRLMGDQTQLLAIGGLQNLNYTGDSDVEPVLGMAVSHYLTDNLEARVSVLGGVEDTEYMTSALALNYHFGSHAAKDVAEEPAPEPKKAEPVVLMTKTLRAHFDNDSNVVRPDDKREIQAVSDVMKKNPGSTATLVGHTDSNASDEYNQALSERRAAAVKAVMVSEGVSSDAVETSGRGESEPVEDNATKAGRQANRRVEAVVTGINE